MVNVTWPSRAALLQLSCVVFFMTCLTFICEFCREPVNAVVQTTRHWRNGLTAAVYSYKGAPIGWNKETQQSWCHVQTVCDRAACLWCADCFPAASQKKLTQPGSPTRADDQSEKAQRSSQSSRLLCRICIESLCPDSASVCGGVSVCVRLCVWCLSCCFYMY